MRDLDWIKDLVEAEQKMEESGMIDFTAGYNPDEALKTETVKFLNQIKELFIDYATVFNKYRGLAVGGVKIYGISKTQADFMLFRNGFKLFFIMEKPGTITIRSQFHGAEYAPGSALSAPQIDSLGPDEYIEARWGAFGAIIWTHQELEVRQENLVKFHFTKFVRESSK